VAGRIGASNAGQRRDPIRGLSGTKRLQRDPRSGEIGSEDTYFVYSDAADTALNYPEKNRIRWMEPLYGLGQVRFPGEEDPAGFTRGEGSPNVSGTAMRQAIQGCDMEAFRAGLPDGVDAENVYNILCGKVNERYLRTYVRAIIAG